MTSTTKQIATPDRPDIDLARILLHGVWNEHLQMRGVEIIAVIEFANGETEHRVYDFWPAVAAESTDAYGGWDMANPRWERIMTEAAEWLRNELVPPCSMIAS